MDISLVSCVPFVALCRFVGIVESIRSATERSRDIRFYRPSISLRWYILSRQNPGRPVSSDKNLSRGRTTRGRLEDAPTVVPASICSTRAGSARSTALFLSIVPDDLTLAFGGPIDSDDEKTSSSTTTTGAAAAAAAAVVGSSPSKKKRQPPPPSTKTSLSLSLSLSRLSERNKREQRALNNECRSGVKIRSGKNWKKKKKTKIQCQKSSHSAGCIADPLSCHPPPPKKKRYSMPPPRRKSSLSSNDDAAKKKKPSE